MKRKIALLMFTTVLISAPLFAQIVSPPKKTAGDDAVTTGLQSALKKVLKPYDAGGDWVKVTDDGLKYLDVFEGEGREVKPGVACHVHLKGYRENGVKFTDTLKDGQWFVFTKDLEGQVIKGLNLCMKGMKEGGKRVMVIPSKYSYGDKGYKDSVVDIKPGETLIMDVSLMWIREPEWDKVKLFK